MFFDSLKPLLRAMTIAGFAILSAPAVRAELVFDNTAFVLKAIQKSGSGAFQTITQTYEPQGENTHQCELYVHPRPKSSVAGIMNVDKNIMRPPVTLAPIDIISKPSAKHKEDATSIILVKHDEDSAKFKVILHRATWISDDLVRDLHVECAVKYTGLFSKSTSEFEKLKSAWVNDVFELEPEFGAAP